MPLTKQQQEICLFLAYHIVNEFPEILNYTKNAKITLFQGTDYEETHENYNYSLEGGRYSLKGADGLKTGSSPTADYNYTLTVNRGNQRFVQVIMGSWALRCGNCREPAPRHWKCPD